ncbi:MAG TPA: SiaB family protein kinase [Bacteroidia bacterium]|jgi:hypothetical protein|nr:SiaB family protein kinase [Bacteroidia bacterium]
MDLKKSSSVEQSIFTERVSAIRAAYKSEDNKIIVSHIGELDQRKINTLSSLVEAQLEYLRVNKTTTKKIFNIVIEALQNIALHGEKSEGDAPLNYLLVGKTQNEFIVYAGNVVPNKHVKNLDARLKRIQSFSTFELKKQYMDVLTHGTLSEKGGAGLGFLTMALKAQEINFDFVILNDQYSLFSIQLKVLK